MKHGHFTGGKMSSEYGTWNMMRQRCGNKNNAAYKNYGGRGIKVCQRWAFFENFFADMGPRPHRTLTLDRINNDGNYEPGNCRWATRAQQRINRRSVRPGLMPRGERHHNARLNAPKARVIHRCLEIGGMSHSKIAACFGVDKETVGNINRGNTWGHVTGRTRATK